MTRIKEIPPSFISGDLTGIRYVIEGGVYKEQEEVGAPEGTTMLVRSLFFNLIIAVGAVDHRLSEKTADGYAFPLPGKRQKLSRDIPAVNPTDRLSMRR